MYSKNYLLFGNGSVEIIQMLSRVLLNDGDNIITELPSFSSYFSEAKIQNANIKTIEYDTNYSFNLSKILNLIDDRTKMIYITNPNNPLGTIIKSNELIECVLRTFSKAYGLASLRIGYIVANSNIINELE